MSQVPMVVLLVKAGMPLVRTWGGWQVSEEFFDNDQRAARKAGCDTPYYDFISGEPYSKWTAY